MVSTASDVERSGRSTLRYWPVIVVVVIVLVVAGLSAWLAIRRTMRVTQQRILHLLVETDYHVLLDACRELSARVADGSLEPGQYSVRGAPDPEVSAFPPVLLDVQPNYILVQRDGFVTVEMLGFPSYGVRAVPESYGEGTYPPGDVELIPGLYFYHEDYDKYADTREYFDALIAEGKSRQAQTNGAASTGPENPPAE